MGNCEACGGMQIPDDEMEKHKTEKHPEGGGSGEAAGEGEAPKTE